MDSAFAEVTESFLSTACATEKGIPVNDADKTTAITERTRFPPTKKTLAHVSLLNLERILLSRNVSADYVASSTFALMTSLFSSNLQHMKLTAVIWPSEDGGYCVLNPETGCASQGESVEEALANIKEATQAY